jgi:hypothetical protein|tara:strand:+ start:191 stop:406 length:216 start_codon:yes stop_codon:yes gene_type:complete
MVESHAIGILVYWKLKIYSVIILYFHPLWFSRQKWAETPSTFNIKARGLPSLGEEIELRRSIWVVFYFMAV